MKWCRNVAATLKRERQSITDEMKRNTNLANGGTPWWRSRPKWKLGTKNNYCAKIPLIWGGILCDAKPSVTYAARDRKKQRRADIATAAWDEAYSYNKWERVVHKAVVISQVQKVAYLSLRPKVVGDQVVPRLVALRGEQVYLDQNASCVDEAEIALIEYPESYGSLCSRFEGLRGKLQRKYEAHKDRKAGEQSQLAPPATYSFSGLSPGGNSPSVNTPPYAATPNPPDGASGSAGMQVQEFWTRPHKTISVEEVQFLTTGEPATEPKMYETIDPDDSEPLRRVVTEGGVIYELPESLVDMLHSFPGGIKIVSDKPALQCKMHKVKYPLYPHGRLVVIVDEDIKADDRMNPLGYIPLAEIHANEALDGGFYGPSSVDLIADVYENFVRTISGIGDNIILTGNNIWRMPIDSSIANDDITNAPGSIQREDLMALKYGKREPAPTLPNYIPQHVRFMKEEMFELAGLNDYIRGKTAPRQQISTETNTANQEAAGVGARDALSSISIAMQTLGEQFLEFMARFYTSPVVVQLKNNAGVPEPVPMLGAYLTDPFIVEAKAGSRQPSGPTARLTTIMNMIQAHIPVPLQTVYDLFEEIGSIPSSTGMLREVERLMRDPANKWQLLGLPPPPGQQGKKPGSGSKQSGSKRQRKQGVGIAG